MSCLPLPSDKGDVNANEDVPGYTFRFKRWWSAAIAYRFHDEDEREGRGLHQRAVADPEKGGGA
jgi:hypothetical protein